MKTIFVLFIFIIQWSRFYAQEQRHSFSPLESVIYSNVVLDITSTQEWSTDRLAFPGYFSAFDTAIYINYSDNFNINGHVKHYVRQPNQSFLFPVGTGTDLRTLQTSGTIPNNSEFATAWILGDPSNNNDLTLPNAGPHNVLLFAAPLKFVSTIGQWDWQDISNTSAGVTITVSIPDMTSFSAKDDLRLAGWNGTQWIDLSGGPSATGNTENSLLTGTMQSNITALAIATIYHVSLPVTIIKFWATAQSCDALVKWETENESMMQHYELQQSFNGRDFTTIHIVTSNQNRNSNIYDRLAIQPQGQAYYRLKMIEQNYDFTYSEIISLRTNCNDKNFMVAFPNPVSNATNGIVTVRYRNFAGTKGSLILFDEKGTIIIKKDIVFDGNSNMVQLNLKNVAQANYILSIYDKNNTLIGNSIKLIKLQ